MQASFSNNYKLMLKLENGVFSCQSVTACSIFLWKKHVKRVAVCRFRYLLKDEIIFHKTCRVKCLFECCIPCHGITTKLCQQG